MIRYVVSDVIVIDDLKGDSKGELRGDLKLGFGM